MIEVAVIGFIRGRWYGLDTADRRPMRFNFPVSLNALHKLLEFVLDTDEGEVTVSILSEWLV